MASFSFNLLPPATKEELMQIDERDNALIYSLILILSAIFIALVIFLIDSSIVKGRITGLENTKKIIEAEISRSDEIVSKNGEIFLKSNLLAPILENDIKINELFLVSDQIAPNNNITSYRRNATGEFIVNIEVRDYLEGIEIIERAKTNELLEDVLIRSVTQSEVGFNLSVEFKIKV